MKQFTVYSSQLTVSKESAWVKPVRVGAWRAKPLLFTVNCLLITLFAACIPARTPGNLANTPGAPAVITDEEYRGELFNARPPGGWRVITGAAGFPQTVTFVAPGDCAIISLSTAPLNPPALPPHCPPAQTETGQVVLEARTIYAVGAAPADDWTTFMVEYPQVMASVSPPGA
jgi:hypothetical protein